MEDIGSDDILKVLREPYMPISQRVGKGTAIIYSESGMYWGVTTFGGVARTVYTYLPTYLLASRQGHDHHIPCESCKCVKLRLGT